jgi:DNA replication protein DnaD
MAVIGRDAFQSKQTNSASKEKGSRSLGIYNSDTENSYHTLHSSDVHKVMHKVRENFQTELSPSQLQKLQACLESATRQHSVADHHSMDRQALPSFDLSQEKGCLELP